jgi:DNA (cytosine-5)-methyltransferase 1
MLEFYYLHHLNKFETKAKELSDELKYIFDLEQIVVLHAPENAIPNQYQDLLSHEVFTQLNNFYYTIRNINLPKAHFLNKYLPETKKLVDSTLLFADFFSGVGGLSQGFAHAGFTPCVCK